MIAQRNGLLDVLRFVAAIGILVFHLKLPGGSWGLSALSFFTAILCYFAASSTVQGSLKSRFKKLTVRLFWPWIIWSLIYTLAKLANAYVDGTSYQGEFASWMWWTGPSIHLWFLPFAFTVSLLIGQFLAPIRMDQWVFWILALAIIPLCLICFSSVEQKLFNTPWNQWVSVLPATVVGIALAAVHGKTNRIIGLVVSISIAFFATQWAQLHWLSFEFCVGTLLAVIGTMFSLRSTRFTKWLGCISLGVYLAHPFCAAALEHVFVPRNNLIKLIATIFLSVILAEFYRRLESYLRASRDFKNTRGKSLKPV